jgi:outer membrane biogenesis lipoprotein LolB
MNTMKRWKGMLAGAVLLMLAGCGGEEQVQAQEPEPEEKAVIYRPVVHHPKELSTEERQTVQTLKTLAEGSSMKLHPDKTFGIKLGQVMFGNWSRKDDIITLRMTSIVGQSEDEVAKLPPRERIQRFRVLRDGDLLRPHPDTGQKILLLWKKHEED